MAKTKKTFDSLPDMVEDIFPIWQKEIDRINSLSEPTKEDIKLTISLSQTMMQSYLQFRLLKAEVKKELQAIPTQTIRNMVNKQPNASQTKN